MLPQWANSLSPLTNFIYSLRFSSNQYWKLLPSDIWKENYNLDHKVSDSLYCVAVASKVCHLTDHALLYFTTDTHPHSFPLNQNILENHLIKFIIGISHRNGMGSVCPQHKSFITTIIKTHPFSKGQSTPFLTPSWPKNSDQAIISR